MPFEGDLGDQSPSLPCNIEAEQSLIGSILLQNAVYHRVSETLRPEHFWAGAHGRIYEAAGRLIERGVIANPITLKNLFDQDETLKNVAGSMYLARLVESAVTIVNAPHYATAIIDCHRRRELVSIADTLDRQARVATLDLTAEQIADAAADALARIAEPGGAEAKPAAWSVGDAAMASMQRSEAAYRGEGAKVGVASGVGALDTITGGWQPEDFIVIGKRPGMGGTATAITLALNAARAGHSVLFHSAEMSAERIGARVLAWLTGVTARAQRAGELSQNEWSALIAAQEKLRALRLTIDDTAPVGVGTIRRRAKRAKPDLLIVDYLQLIRSGDGTEDVPLKDSVPAVSHALRDLARELAVPVIALAQLDPSIDKRDNKRPMLGDIRWSGDVSQDAAVVAMLYREFYYLEAAEPRAAPNDDPMKVDKMHAQWASALAASRDRAEIIVLKNRDDQTGVAHVKFDGARSMICDLDENQGRFW